MAAVAVVAAATPAAPQPQPVAVAASNAANVIVDHTEMFGADLFDNLDPDFICSICTHVLRKPQELPCAHLFCQQCIIQWLTTKPSCPTCRSVTMLDALRNSHYVQNKIWGQTVKCKNSPQGCPSACVLGTEERNMRTHLTECRYQSVNCGQCHTMVLRRDMDDHGTRTCAARLVSCYLCHRVMQSRALEDHMKGDKGLCQGLRICPNGCCQESKRSSSSSSNSDKKGTTSKQSKQAVAKAAVARRNTKPSAAPATDGDDEEEEEEDDDNDAVDLTDVAPAAPTDDDEEEEEEEEEDDDDDASDAAPRVKHERSSQQRSSTLVGSSGEEDDSPKTQLAGRSLSSTQRETKDADKRFNNNIIVGASSSSSSSSGGTKRRRDATNSGTSSKKRIRVKKERPTSVAGAVESDAIRRALGSRAGSVTVIDVDLLETHLEACPLQRLQCKMCDQHLTRREMPRHMKKRAGDHSWKLYERLAALEKQSESEIRKRDDEQRKMLAEVKRLDENNTELRKRIDDSEIRLRQGKLAFDFTVDDWHSKRIGEIMYSPQVRLGSTEWRIKATKTSATDVGFHLTYAKGPIPLSVAKMYFIRRVGTPAGCAMSAPEHSYTYNRYVGVGDSKFSTLEKLEEAGGYDVVEDTITFGIRLRLPELVDKAAVGMAGPVWMDNIDHQHVLDD